MIDYHVHTSLCKHADGEMTAYVQRAIDAGLAEICFLDHLTICELGRSLSMAPEEVPAYFEAVQRLKSTFAGRIRVKAGLEVDFDPLHVARVEKIISAHPFDAIGSSIHFIDELDIVRLGENWHRGGGNTEAVYGRFFDRFEQMLDCDYFDFICHFDVIAKTGRLPNKSFEDRTERILTTISRKKLAVEVNTSGYDHPIGRTYPAAEVIERCAIKGIPLTLGSDAHRPDEVGRHFKRTIGLLKAEGVRHLTTFTRRRPEQIPLSRGTTQHEAAA